MSNTNVKKITCPNCRGKVNVIVEPFHEEVVCPYCNVRLKVLRELGMITQFPYTGRPSITTHRYSLQIITE